MPLRHPRKPKLARFHEPKAFRPPPPPGTIGSVRGPRSLTGVLRTLVPPWKTPGSAWPGSGGEWAVFWALTVGLRKQDGVDFIYQGKFLGGRQQLGGVVPDFVMIDGSSIAINVDSVFFHARGAPERAADVLAGELLAARGFLLIHLWEADLLTETSPVPTVQLALQGIQPQGNQPPGGL